MINAPVSDILKRVLDDVWGCQKYNIQLRVHYQYLSWKMVCSSRSDPNSTMAPRRTSNASSSSKATSVRMDKLKEHSAKTQQATVALTLEKLLEHLNSRPGVASHILTMLECGAYDEIDQSEGDLRGQPPSELQQVQSFVQGGSDGAHGFFDAVLGVVWRFAKDFQEGVRRACLPCAFWCMLHLTAPCPQKTSQDCRSGAGN